MGTLGRFALWMLILPPLFSGCGKFPPRLPFPAGRTPAPAVSPTQHRAQDDPELARIAQNARRTLAVFFRRLQSPLPGDGNFRIKYPLRADVRSGFSREQVWLSDIRFRDGVYSGVPDHSPYYVSGLARGERIDFNIEEITDWMFTRHGRITGGRSIKYLLEQIPEPERDEEQRLILDMFE
jgi:uncharacterized protein YegJ (DUF2314 family)